MKIDDIQSRKVLLAELDQHDIGYYNHDDDVLNVLDYNDTRKPKLTLAHLNKLKKLKATRELENAKQSKILNLMYGNSSKGGDDGGGGLGI